MKINLSILCIMLTGLSLVHSQANEKESLVEKMETIPSQTLVDGLVNRIPGARKITDRYGLQCPLSRRWYRRRHFHSP